MEVQELDTFSFEEEKSNISDVQRTEEWYKKRSGNFTGSRINNLMSCGRSSIKLSWNDSSKTFDFGVAAEKYVYEVGMERLTGFRSQQVTSASMRYGTESEPILIQQLLNDGVIQHYDEMSYIPHEEVPNLGASPDGKIIFDGKEMALEIKCTVSWDGYYKRKYEEVDEKHCDFWQFQTEMLVMGLDSLLYVVSYPMTTEKYEVVEVKASPIHQECIKKRVLIANEAISLWDNYSGKKSLAMAISNFKL